MRLGLDIPDRTPEQAREAIARKDRQGWFAAEHASGAFGIISRRTGFEIARCDSREDWDAILTMARSHDGLKAALAELLEQIECLGGIEFSKDLEPYKAEAVWDDAISRARDALALARAAAVLKTADEIASEPGAMK